MGTTRRRPERLTLLKDTASHTVRDMTSRGLSRLVQVALVILIGCVLPLQGCGGSSSPGAMTSSTTPKTPTVSVMPSLTSLTTAQALSVTIAVSGGSSNATPTGSVTLVSGSYASSATILSSGSATISIPAGSLGTGNDTLTASYTPDAASSPDYNSTSGSSSVTVTASPGTPTVTATYVTYPT